MAASSFPRSLVPAFNRHSAPRRARALGNNAKNCPPLNYKGVFPSSGSGSADGWVIDPVTGETRPEKPRTSVEARAERFALKSHVAELLPNSRTAKCLWRRCASKVDVMRDKSHGRAFFRGLQTCSSVWACPMCAAKIAERRRVELTGAMARADELGFQVSLVTLTVPHGLGDDIRAMLDQLGKAWRFMTHGKQSDAMWRFLGRVGFVRALEVTDGPHGFHPHFHILLFTRRGPSLEVMQGILSAAWMLACSKAGLPSPHGTYGCRVDDGSKAAAYVAKGSGWGLECEMTKSHLKRSRSDKGYSPLDLLRASFYDDDKRARARWLIYADAFHGRRQLFWSVGLKKLLAVVDLTDEEIAAAESEKATVVYSLDADQWRLVIRCKAEALILSYAETRPDALPLLLTRLAAIPDG